MVLAFIAWAVCCFFISRFSYDLYREKWCTVPRFLYGYVVLYGTGGKENCRQQDKHCRKMMMKRMFSIGFFVLLFALCYGQDVKVNINNQEVGGQKEDCAFRINGICSSEDIGGVDVQEGYEQYNESASSYKRKLVFTNYNDFTVTVLYQVYDEITSAGRSETRTGQMVLKKDESKTIVSNQGPTWLSYLRFTLEGIIVRKLRD